MPNTTQPVRRLPTQHTHTHLGRVQSILRLPVKLGRQSILLLHMLYTQTQTYIHAQATTNTPSQIYRLRCRNTDTAHTTQHTRAHSNNHIQHTTTHQQQPAHNPLTTHKPHTTPLTTHTYAQHGVGVAYMGYTKCNKNTCTHTNTTRTVRHPPPLQFLWVSLRVRVFVCLCVLCVCVFVCVYTYGAVCTRTGVYVFWCMYFGV